MSALDSMLQWYKQGELSVLKGLKNSNPENQTKKRKRLPYVAGIGWSGLSPLINLVTGDISLVLVTLVTALQTPFSVAMNVPAGKEITFPLSQCTENEHFICFHLMLEFLSCFSILEKNTQGRIGILHNQQN